MKSYNNLKSNSSNENIFLFPNSTSRNSSAMSQQDPLLDSTRGKLSDICIKVEIL